MPSLVPFRRMSYPSWASAIRLFTTAVLCGTIGVWLVIWLAFIRPTVHFAVLAPSPIRKPAVVGMLTGLHPHTFGIDATRPVVVATLKTIEQVVEYLAKHNDRPTVLYVAAPLSSRTPEEPNRPEWEGVISFTGVEGSMGIERLLDACLRRPGRQKLLLLVDPGQVGTSLTLGVVGDSVASKLRRRAEADQLEKRPWSRFGILCACSPEQWSWPIEARGRSAFDDRLADALRRPIHFRELRNRVEREVPALVSKYVDRATQNPMYLGDPDLDFFIPSGTPRRMPSPTEGDPSEQKSWLALQEAFARRDRHEARRPALYAAPAWRHYQECLLDAERLFRAGRGRGPEVIAALDLARQAEAGLVSPNPADSFGSIALGLRYAANFQGVDALDKTADQTLVQALQIPATAPSGGSPSPPGPSPKVAAGIAPSVLGGVLAPAEPISQPSLFVDLRNLMPGVKHAWSEFAEGQMIDWVAKYRAIPGADQEAIFEGWRGELLRQSVLLRRRAEQSAASALVDYPPLRRAVEEGDDHRRKGQDALFLGQADAPGRVQDEFKQAERAYQRAEDLADALEWRGRVESELPFLGAWLVHAGNRERLDPQTLLRTIADAGRNLADRLKEEPPDLTALMLARDKVKRAFNPIRTAFQDRVRDQLARLGSSPDWRTVDELLLVPSISAGRRAALLGRFHPAAMAPPEPPSEPSQPGGKGVEEEEAKKRAMTRQVLGGSAGAAGREYLQSEADKLTRSVKNLHEAPAEDFSNLGPEMPTFVADPAYPIVAAGLARLEVTLLRTQGENFGDGLEDLIVGVGATNPELASRSRAKLAEIGGRRRAIPPETFSSRLGVLNKWMAWRLRLDYDRDRAGRLDESSRPDGSIAVSLRCEPNRIDLNAVPFAIEVDAEGDVPEGSGCLLLHVDNRGGGDSVAVSGRVPVAGGVDTPIVPGRPSSIEFEANRAFRGDPDSKATPGGPSRVATMAATVFYRGKAFPAAPKSLDLPPVVDPFLITIRSDFLDRKQFPHQPKDQFYDHPGHGYVYPGATHPYIVSICYRPSADAPATKPVDVDVEWKLESPGGSGTPGPTAGGEIRAIKLDPGQVVRLLAGKIDFEGHPAKPDPMATTATLREQKLIVIVRPKGGGPKEFSRRVFPFSEVNPNFYVNVSNTMINSENDTVLFRVERRHDPIVKEIPIEVRTRIPVGSEKLSKTLDRGGKVYFQFEVPPVMRPADFDFYVGSWKVAYWKIFTAAPPVPNLPAPLDPTKTPQPTPSGVPPG